MNVALHPYYFSRQKRLFDVSVCVILLAIGWPFLILIIAALYFFSGRPIFFAQKRTGKNKQTFLMWKFRSMRLSAEKEKQSARLQKLNQAPWPMFKAANDPRYTKIGRLLSLTGIDELPQIWNILRGEMSVVGPRPLPIKESAKLDKSWDFRYKVLPGIISEWAVNPKRYQSLAKWQKLEKETVKRGGWKYDWQLIGRTVKYLANCLHFL